MAEKRWEWDVVDPDGKPTRPKDTAITPESIVAYATRARNPNPRYREPKEGMLAIPMQAFAAMRPRRNEVAAANGYVALEWARENPRQTPYTKGTMRWFAPMRAGDTITSSSRVVDKYERRGNRFVTFLMDGVNQRGEKIAENLLTCIFEYGPGQKERQSDGPSARPAHSEEVRTGAMLGRNATFASIQPGDELPPIEVAETQETIDGFGGATPIEERPPKNIHTDPDFAAEGIFAGTVNAGVATMAYIVQMFEQVFPAEAFYDGGSLEFKAIEPVRPGDTISLTGRVAAKREEDGKKLVDCEIKGMNQLGQLIAAAEATLVVE